MRLLVPLILVVLIPSCSSAKKNPWIEVRSPAAHLPPESIGKYAGGCLAGATSLNVDETQKYIVMRPSRRRFYGHPNLIKQVQRVSRSINKKHLGRMMVGDLSLARGGPVLSGHQSHQTGLDADIWYELASSKEQVTAEQRENYSAPSVLSVDGKTLDPKIWTPKAKALVLEWASQPTVERILVTPAVKQDLCNDLAQMKNKKRRNRKTENALAKKIRKIRPWWAHADHFHVRLECPADSPQCRKQDLTPAGDGCDASLAWWFSEEATQLAKEKSAEPPSTEIPELPTACNKVLSDPTSPSVASGT